MLIDWVLTAHSFTGELMEFLSTPLVDSIRREAAKVLLDYESKATFSKEELALLIKLVPFTFRFGSNDCGYSLKCKLYTEFYRFPVKLNLNLEVRDAADNNKTQDNSTGSAPNSTGAPNIPLSTGESVPEADRNLYLNGCLGGV